MSEILEQTSSQTERDSRGSFWASFTGVNIRVKLLFATFIVLSVVVFFQTGVNLRVSREVSEKAERDHLYFLYDGYNDYIKAQTVSSGALSLSYADREDVKDLYLAGDRDALYTLLSPIFEITSFDSYQDKKAYFLES